MTPPRFPAGRARGGAEAKRALRERLLERRSALSPAELIEAAAALCEVVLGDRRVSRARLVAAYVSVGTEPGTGPLLDALLDRGCEVLLPRLQPDHGLDWAPYHGPGSLQRAPRGLLEPRAQGWGESAIGRADVVLVPGLAADRRGSRLGRGGGSYDRALRHAATAWRVAVLHRGELLDLPLPVEPHDQPVHAAATPDGLVELRR